MEKIDITHLGSFIDSAEARKNLKAYLDDTGKPQHEPAHPDHVFGHIFGLAKIKELVTKIDHHNATEKDPEKQIAGLRMYNAKSVRKGKPGDHVRDLLVVPVTKDGHDFPQKIHGGAAAAESPVAPRFILADSRPCPNQCGT